MIKNSCVQKKDFGYAFLLVLEKLKFVSKNNVTKIKNGLTQNCSHLLEIRKSSYGVLLKNILCKFPFYHLTFEKYICDTVGCNLKRMFKNTFTTFSIFYSITFLSYFLLLSKCIFHFLLLTSVRKIILTNLELSSTKIEIVRKNEIDFCENKNRREKKLTKFTKCKIVINTKIFFIKL